MAKPWLTAAWRLLGRRKAGVPDGLQRVNLNRSATALNVAGCSARRDSPRPWGPGQVQFFDTKSTDWEMSYADGV